MIGTSSYQFQFLTVAALRIHMRTITYIGIAVSPIDFLWRGGKKMRIFTFFWILKNEESEINQKIGNWKYKTRNL